MKIGAVILGALLTSVPAYLVAGTLAYKCNRFSCAYEFRGEIAASDVTSFTAIKRVGEERIIFDIDSDGGDVRAAIKIARHLQEIMAETWSARCVSACVIVLGASPYRAGQKVGIHRIYTTSSEGTFAQRQSDFDQLGSEVKALFRRSGVRESLWEDMQRISPEKVKWLSFDDEFHYGLNGPSPAYTDFQDAGHAKRMGISKQELLKRKAEAERHCRRLIKLVEEVACRRRIVGDDLAIW